MKLRLQLTVTDDLNVLVVYTSQQPGTRHIHAVHGGQGISRRSGEFLTNTITNIRTICYKNEEKLHVSCPFIQKRSVDRNKVSATRGLTSQ